LAALSIRPFRWWFFAQVTSASGLITQVVAVAWLVLQWGGNGIDLAVVSAAGLTPTLFLGLWAGSLVDHYDRRHILIATQSALAAISLVLFVLIASGAAHYWSLLLLMASSGVVNAIDGPARQVYVLDLVGPERLAGAVSLYEVVLNLSRICGPAIGGALLAISGPSACVLVNTVTFAAPIAVLLHYQTRRTDKARQDGGSRPSALAGLRYALARPFLRASLLLAVASTVIFNPTVMLPLLATHTYHLGAGGYGALLALFGIGALPGALLVSRRTPTGMQVRVLAVLTGVCVAIVAFAPSRPILFAAMLATGTTSIWMIASANTLVQLRTAPELRGRVMGAWTMALPGMSPITGLIVGALADAFSPRVAYGATGAVIALIAITCWGSFGSA
jgi:MFS family permease